MNNSSKIRAMTKGGLILSEIMTQTLAKVVVGMSTADIENEIANKIDQSGAKSSFKTVDHYPYYSCVGLNNEVVHSLPNPKKIIQKGDLLKVDTGLIWDGWHTDMSWTVEINQKGQVEYSNKFLDAGKQALAEAIKQCRSGNHVGDISQTIQQQIESFGYSIVKQLTGHCIGKKLHEKPYIPGFLNQKIEKTPELTPGMTLAVEIIYSQGNGHIVVENDGWTISTQDDKMSALFEQTIAITTESPLILTPVPVKS